MTNPDQVIAVCSRTKELPASGTVPGSSTTQCSDCRERVWISPHTMQRPDIGKITFLCTHCAISKGIWKEDEVVPLTEAQIQTLIAQGMTRERIQEAWEDTKRMLTRVQREQQDADALRKDGSRVSYALSLAMIAKIAEAKELPELCESCLERPPTKIGALQGKPMAFCHQCYHYEFGDVCHDPENPPAGP